MYLFELIIVLKCANDFLHRHSYLQQNKYYWRESKYALANPKLSIQLIWNIVRILSPKIVTKAH